MSKPTLAVQKCIAACLACRQTCQEIFFHHCLTIGGVHMEERHAKAMLECIDICQIAADFMARGSEHDHAICQLCADICDACAKSCEQIGDDDMMRAANACSACAESCRHMGDMRDAA